VPAKQVTKPIKIRDMTRLQIFKAACKLNAEDFLYLMYHNDVAIVILEVDNTMNPNAGRLNVAAKGLEKDEAILFIDGEFCG
jgi:hypothetical protein